MTGASMRVTLSLSDDRDRTAVERAIAELRMGRPVLIEGEAGAILVHGIEDLTAERAGQLEVLAGGKARLVLPGARLRRLGATQGQNGAIALPGVDLARVRQLAFELEARLDAPVAAVSPLDEVALELARLALALPAVIVLPLDGGAVDVDPSLLRVSAAAVSGYRLAQAKNLAIVGRAPVPLEEAHETEFVVFRGGEGLRDQVAVVVGQPDITKPVAVRLHSACLTGDLFGSLKCDCGDQLRGSVSWMAENGGGILLYLDQEGRGNGIANKIRAYKLQAQGYDTYDADEMLGFGPDQRRFDFAAEMLRKLGVTQVRLITNNPDKIAALQQAGLDVVSHQRTVQRTTPENLRYLATKRDKAGHMLEVGAPARTGSE